MAANNAEQLAAEASAPHVIRVRLTGHGGLNDEEAADLRARTGISGVRLTHFKFALWATRHGLPLFEVRSHSVAAFVT
jgi:hypothetical protein